MAGYRPGQHQKVAGHQSLQLVEQSLYFRLCRLGAWGVNIRLPIGKDLHINSGVARCQRHKIRLNPLGLQHLLQGPAGKSGHESQRSGGHSQSGQHHGHIDTFATAQQLSAVRPIYILAAQPWQAQNVVQRRVQRYGIDHNNATFLTTVRSPYSGSGSRSVMMAA